eukprot:459082-Amphidinium_carterae.1
MRPSHSTAEATCNFVSVSPGQTSPRVANDLATVNGPTGTWQTVSLKGCEHCGHFSVAEQSVDACHKQPIGA